MRRWGVNNLPNFLLRSSVTAEARTHDPWVASNDIDYSIYIYSTVNYNIILAIASTLHTAMKHLVHTCVLHLELTTEL